MLSGRDMAIVGAWCGGEAYCRQCVVKQMGVLFVELLEHGMRAMPKDWTPVYDAWSWQLMSRYAADHHAVERGYEEAAQYHDNCEASGGCKANQNEAGEWYCEACAQTLCDDCGKRLDWTQGEQDAAEYAAAEAGRDLLAWP